MFQPTQRRISEKIKSTLDSDALPFHEILDADMVEMGPAVVPLILDELRREPDQWFWALESITEQNPVPPEAMGKVRRMAEAWVTLGEQQDMLGNER